MKDKDFEKYIDEYYTNRESQLNTESSNSDDENLVRSSLDRMDILKDMENIDLNIDIMSVIAQGDEVIQAKKDRKELLLFVICGISLIFSFASVCILINKEIFVYVELAIAVLLPYALIPLAYIKTARGKY